MSINEESSSEQPNLVFQNTPQTRKSKVEQQKDFLLKGHEYAKSVPHLLQVGHMPEYRRYFIKDTNFVSEPRRKLSVHLMPNAVIKSTSPHDAEVAM